MPPLPAGWGRGNPGAVIRGIADGADNVEIRAISLGVEHLEGHHFGPPGHAGDADAVVAHGGQDAGDMGAVAVIILRVIVLIDEVIAGQEVAGQVRVPRVHAGIHQGNDHGIALGLLPGGGHADLPHVPLPPPGRVIGFAGDVGDVVGADIFDERVGAEEVNQLLLHPGLDSDELEVQGLLHGQGLYAHAQQGGGRHHRGQALPEAHDQLAGDIGGVFRGGMRAFCLHAVCQEQEENEKHAGGEADGRRFSGGGLSLTWVGLSVHPRFFLGQDIMSVTA
jgi:hypothetical protein